MASNKKIHIKTGDTVKIIAGNDKGKTGKVIKVIPSKDRALVEGFNIATKHIKPSASNPNGGIEKKEAGIHVSNLMVVDANGDATKIGRKKNEAGKSERFSKKSGEIIK